MISTLIFIWYLLTTPTDKLICTLWVSQPPDNAALVSACGNLDHRNLMIWRAVDIQSGTIACEGSASELPAINCNLAHLSDYRIEVIWPDYQEMECSVTMTDPGMPDANTIANQCPQQAADFTAGNLILKFMGSKPKDPDPVPVCPMKPLGAGTGIYDLPPRSEDLQTSTAYDLLAGKLIWYGIGGAMNCDGWSGVDPTTHAATQCGLESVMPVLISWQNQFDQAIYDTAAQAQVPPKLLKGLISVESQFWPLAVGTIGEAGMIQLTDPGADIALQYSPMLYHSMCPSAIGSQDCSNPYETLTSSEQSAIRDYLRAVLTFQESPKWAVSNAKDTMWINASVLSAYYCYTGELTGTPSWETTLAVYHDGAACVSNGMICADGLDYIAMVTK